MRKTRYFILGALVLSLGAAPALTHASWGGGPGGGGGHGRFGGPMMGGGPGMFLHVILKKLNLTSEQQSLLDSKLAPHKATIRPLFQQTRTLQRELDMKLFSTGPLSATDPDVVALTSKVATLREQMANEGLATALDIRAFLIDQNLWPQAIQLWQKMQAMREEMHNFFDETQ